MGITGSRVAVAGGSIAGCAAAIALGRAGCEVTVFERSGGDLQDRGTGIGIPLPVMEQLIAGGYLSAGYPFVPIERRWWYVADGTHDGRIAWEQAGGSRRSRMNNWAVLWKSLRAKVDDACYHRPVSVTGFDPVDAGVRVRTSDGAAETFDLLVGADGYRSVVRAGLHPGSSPEYAGYVLWRGNYPESRIDDRAVVDRLDAAEAGAVVVYPGGHALLYAIPGLDDRVDRGHRRMTWNLYSAAPEGLEFGDPASLAPGSLDDAMHAYLDQLVIRHVPPSIAALIRASEPSEISLQPIYDLTVASYVGDRVLLIGDAGAVTRPHTGSGATKALTDAIALERLATTLDDWEAILAAYDEERCPASNGIVELGRRIGRAQVTDTPDWQRMTPADFDAWMASRFAGDVAPAGTGKALFWGAPAS